MTTSNHNRLMALAIRLAKRGLYTTSPNPRVGCVIEKNGQVIGKGWHQWAGQAHAEVNALRDAGEAAEGATAYVTLEPCSHHGKTPPCAEALISAGVSRVIYGMQDPNPQVAGSGLKRLVDAGIEVVGPVMEVECKALNPGFAKRMRTGLPRVTIKMAMSLDGRTAMASGESKWITGSAARSDVQRLRASSCAIVTGIGTVQHDNPAMTVRAEQLELDNGEEIAKRQPLRVVVDSKGQIENDRNICTPSEQLLVVTAGADVDDLPAIALPDNSGKVDLKALLQELANRDCNEVLVEAGAELAGAFVAAGLVDQLVIYMAPKLLGSQARPLLNLPFDTMAEQRRLQITDIRSVGDDLKITAQPM